MKDCYQNDKQSIYDHGISVRNHSLKLIDALKNNTELDYVPDWFLKYKDQILSNLFPINIIEEYTVFHDCGKPYCLIYENGKKHFPNHAEVSAKIWEEHGGNQIVKKLISMDMLIHTIKAKDIDEFCIHDECCTLLLVGLAEIHANAEMFGGWESTSFKIKYKQIDKRGKQICKRMRQLSV